ncbi:hypothetical protein C454_11071 [Haloferax gibbonsii ATCC 33959]|uniref:Uncharacterized protein n=1 Tax=Haloferax gibbonsii (strain ATCC 33959 / DSM 4427 / JCM 8863 / NBRC 102184 / NCIMB 2188 / Ma 2.38) TaxID=1227459 RepID=M0H6N5_HALGM|nr:hypothetical protein [Haloferax gibbonsii]ELZ80150.1 hypothetical protein C454_11071 [Haloferax gibbonsii ATCC 33959]
MTEKEVSIDLPSDENGMFPRQCPNCDGKFAIHSDTYQDEHYLNLRCPYCGWIEEFDQFLTDEQADYSHSVAEGELRRMAEKELSDALEDAFGGISSNSSINLETDSSEIDFGEPETPSPHLSIETKRITCPDCGFNFLVKQDAEEEQVSCPVCR